MIQETKSGVHAMDITSLYYFCEVAKELHITNTAKKLFISQQTLSAHIQKIESYYGAKVFTRHPTMALTEEGRILYESAKVIVEENENVRRHLDDLKTETAGKITVGCSNFIIRTCIAKILPQFHERHPNIKLILDVHSQEHLIRETNNGAIDVSFVFEHGPQNTNLDYRALYKYAVDDVLYLAISNTLLKRYFGDRAEEVRQKSLVGVNVALFADVPFMVHSEGKGLRKRILVDKIFERAGIKPKILLESSKSEHFVPLATANVAAFFCEENYISQVKALTSDIEFFPVLNVDQSDRRSIMVVTNKNRYLNSYVRHFIQMCDKALRSANYIRAAQ